MWYAGTHSPADRNFRRILKPAAITAVHLTPPAGAPAAEYVAASALLTDTAKIGAQARAFWTSEDTRTAPAMPTTGSGTSASCGPASPTLTDSARLFDSLPGLQ